MPLDSASPLEKGLDPKPFIIKSERLCIVNFFDKLTRTVFSTVRV